MKKLFCLILLFAGLSNLISQNWINLIDSMPNSWNNITETVVDTTTNILYLGGTFNQVNNLRTKSIIKYNGVNFDTLGAGLDSQFSSFYSSTSVNSLIMFQNKLYVGGTFQKAGKYYSPNLARWNGLDWDTLNWNPNGIILDMKVYNNELYVSGSFDTIAGIEANNIAKFDGTNWLSLNFPTKNKVMYDIAIFKDTLYANSSVYTGGLLKYNGTNWISLLALSGSSYRQVSKLKVIDSMMFVGGTFDIAQTHCNGLVSFSGQHWYGYGSGVLDSEVGRIDNIDKINGDLYITGRFDGVENLISVDTSRQQYVNLAKFDGQKWCLISPPFNNATSGVVKYNNELYCYGSFTTMGNESVFGFIKWVGGNLVLACSPTITLTQTTVDVGEIRLLDNIKIYPNPTSSIVNIVDEQNQFQNATIQIQNYLGQTVFTSTFASQINLSQLSSGMYFLNIQDNENKIVLKIIKQ